MLTINWSEVGKFSLLDRCHTCARMVFQQFKLVSVIKRNLRVCPWDNIDLVRDSSVLYLAKWTKKKTLIHLSFIIIPCSVRGSRNNCSCALEGNIRLSSIQTAARLNSSR